ncbi:hypothetical protein CRYUN_Cryun05aG0239600 [Craigia yunnanensis]
MLKNFVRGGLLLLYCADSRKIMNCVEEQSLCSFCLPTSTLQEKNQGNIGKSVMKNQPLPEAMKGLLHDDPASAFDSEKKMKHF